MSKLVKESKGFQTTRKGFNDNFISGFWNKCDFNSHCFTAISFKQAYEIYDYYNNIQENEKIEQVSAMIKYEKYLM